jgi:hypothetical protein
LRPFPGLPLVLLDPRPAPHSGIASMATRVGCMAVFVCGTRVGSPIERVYRSLRGGCIGQ